MNCDIICEDCLRELCMRKVPLFASLSYEELKSMADHMSCHTYEKGEILLSIGVVPKEFVIILNGSVKAYTLSADGKEKIQSVLSENDYYGELHLFSDHPAAYMVEALDHVKTCAFSREHFRALLTVHPQMAVKLVEELGKRVVQMETLLQATVTGKVDARIAALLMEFSRKYAVSGSVGLEIALPISREGMANYLGIARETMSRKLKQMEESGLIASHGSKRLILLKPEVIEKMSIGSEEEE